MMIAGRPSKYFWNMAAALPRALWPISSARVSRAAARASAVVNRCGVFTTGPLICWKLPRNNRAQLLESLWGNRWQTKQVLRPAVACM